MQKSGSLLWLLLHLLDQRRKQGRLLHAAYGESMAALADLKQAGLRILPSEAAVPQPRWRDGCIR